MLDFRKMLNVKHTKWIISNSKYYFERNVSNRKTNGSKVLKNGPSEICGKKPCDRQTISPQIY